MFGQKDDDPAVKASGEFLLDCDDVDCHAWSNGRCMGMASAEEVPAHWVCGACALNREIEAQLEQQLAGVTRE